MCRILVTHSHARTVHNILKPSNSSCFKIVGGGECPNERAKHGPVGVGYIWQASLPYLMLKQVDMRRILFTHPHSRTVHITHKTFHPSWFGIVRAGQCPTKPYKSRASMCRIPTSSSITISSAHTDGYVPYLYHINIMLNTHEPSNPRWFGMAGAGKCPNELVKHGPVGAGCIW